ncbi:thioredoxin domain-containing protein [Candidatus Pacearchaeota archaeon]|nr:thioredoxin domain-containing protein [Candidatus Pacearchaeota archaeon]
MDEDKHIPEKEDEETHSHQEGKLTKKMRENPWILSTFVLGVLGLILLVGNFSGGVTGNVVSENDAGEALLNFANNQGAEAELVDVEDIGDFYEVTLMVKGQNLPLMVTKDGEYFLSGGLVSLNEVQQQDSQQEESKDIIKSDKPVVELFIMTHCPYGTQAEKGMIPVMEALGDNADIQIRFVHYYMHEPEETETPRQVCIREEQPEKWLTYLRCFLEDGDADRCLTEVGINQAELNDCVSNNADGYYAEDSDLSNDYGVQGSPTLVINGEIISSARSPAAYLETICQAFNEMPSECELELDTSSPSPMWGWDASGSDTTAQC